MSVLMKRDQHAKHDQKPPQFLSKDEYGVWREKGKAIHTCSDGKGGCYTGATQVFMISSAVRRAHWSTSKTSSIVDNGVGQ